MITAPLTLIRILHRLWDEGKAKDFTYLSEAERLNDEQMWLRGYSHTSRQFETRIVYRDEVDDAWLESRGA